LPCWRAAASLRTDEEVTNFDWLANQASVERVAKQYDATNRNIDRFLRVGKPLIVQGMTDMLVRPRPPTCTTKASWTATGGGIRNAVCYCVGPVTATATVTSTFHGTR